MIGERKDYRKHVNTPVITHDCGSKPPNRDLLLYCKSLEDHNLMEPVPPSCSPQSLVVHSHCASGSILSGHPVASKSSRDATWVYLKMGYTGYTPSFILIGKLIKHVGAPYFQSSPLIGGPTVGVMSYNVVKDQRKPN